jgi:hypothetical protein
LNSFCLNDLSECLYLLFCTQCISEKTKARGNRGEKAKKDFASVALEDDGHSVEQTDIDVVAAAQKSSHSRNESFQRHVSSEGHVYYSNSVTQETVWELPEGAIVV